MPQLTPERERAVGMVQMRATLAFSSSTFGCSLAAVTNLMQRYRQTSDRSRIGRPRVTTPHEERY